MSEQKESNEALVSNLANQPRVFISYARADASDFAEYLYNSLHRKLKRDATSF
jgi:hypothetical protein